MKSHTTHAQPRLSAAAQTADCECYGCSSSLDKLCFLFPKQKSLTVKTKAANVLRLSLLKMEMSGLYCVRIFNFKNCSLSC